MEEMVPHLANPTKPFEVQTIGRLLIKDEHPLAFERRRHYLLGFRFAVKTEKIANSYFQSQKKISAM